MDKSGKSPSSIAFQEGKQPTVDGFFKEFQQFFPLSEETKMEKLSIIDNKVGIHHRFNQFYKGVEVFGAQYILHERKGTVASANGHLVFALDIDVLPTLSEEDALQAALSHIDATSYMWEKTTNEAFLKNETKDNNASFYPKGVLKLSSGNKEMISENVRLVYRFDIYAEQPLGRYWVDVDANSGEIVSKLDRIHHADETASNASLYNGPQDITIDNDGAGTFTMQENTTRATSILTFNLANSTDYASAALFSATSATGFSDPAEIGRASCRERV